MDEEVLLREVLNPDHVKDDKVQPSAVSLDDLRKRGFSIHRLKYVTEALVEDSINKKLVKIVQGNQRTSEGVARFTARCVREISDDGDRVFVVIDTAKLSNKGHASIYLFDVFMGQSRARKMRGKLLPLLENQVSLTQAFAGV